MKRILLALVLAVALVAATALPVMAESAKPEKITVIGDLDSKTFLEMGAKLFTDTYGIKVELITPAYYDAHDKIITTVLGGGDADVVMLDSVWRADFVKAGIVTSLDQYMTEDFKKSLMSCFTDALTVGGKYYTIPGAPNALWLYYNKDLLAKAGYSAPPKTWAELTEMSKKLIDMKLCKYGIAWPACQAEGTICMFTSLLTGFGGSWQDEDGKWVFNSAEGAKALGVLKDTISNGLADPASITYNDRTDLDPLMAGDVAFVPNWAYAYALVNDPKESAVAGSIDVALLPAGADGIVSASCLGGAGYCVTSTCKYPDWAVKFIQALLASEIQDKIMETTGTMPILMSAYSSDYVKEHMPYLSAMADQFNYVVARPALSDYNTWSQQIQLLIANALNGTATVQQTLDDGVKFSEEKYAAK